MLRCAGHCPLTLCRDTVFETPSTSFEPAPCTTIRKVRSQRSGTRRDLRCRAAGTGPLRDDAFFEQGVKEAEEILERATELAEEATRKELLQGFLLESQESSRKGLQTLEPLSAQLRRSEPAFAQPASSLGAEGLVRFWQEEGLRPKAASLLAEVCLKRGGALADPDNLFSLLQRWRRVLPEADVVSMASKDPDLLQAEVSVSIKNLVALRQALPDLDVIKLAEATPSLLWTDDVATCATRTVDLIRKWSPRSDALIIVETYPELIIRIPKYYANCDFFELPLEFQNAMALGGGGGGQTFRSWAAEEDSTGGEWNEELHSGDNNTD